MRKLLSLVVVAALGSSLVACGSDKKDDFDAAGIKVTSDFGQKPTITHREGDPDKSLVTDVLKQGDGPEVKKGELLTANYIGQIWRDGKVFDNSYDRGAPSSFPIGVGSVIGGWDEGLVGKKIGSRVVLSVPSDKGYKTEGNSQAGIKGDDTLIFVVDLVGAAGNDTTLDASPVSPSTPTKITVSGALNAEPKVTVPAGTKPPAKPGKPVVFALGKGKPIDKGSQLIGRYVVYDYTGKKQASTWDAQPATQQSPAQPAAPTDQLQVGPGPNGQTGALDGLAGIPIGSRVLVELPASKDQAGKTVNAFAVIDVMNAFPAPKQTGQ
ncbi:FKBP-type peptidyl-prolyl cis-trans isomerase [Kribbella sp. NPDC048928]|uniref:FKBP-type peptidyl-prolyl cis-trans isomerase n=1 Tax=Kribbella sp. NPDC048928 TaxID=3364111 RepID=UPI003721959A